MIAGYVLIVFVVTACLWAVARIERHEDKDGVYFLVKGRRWSIVVGRRK